MAVSPDDRFAGLINSSAERGGWVPGDVFGSDTDGKDEPVEPRRIRVPILVAVAVATAAVLVVAFLIFRPAQQHAASEEPVGSADDRGPNGAEDSAAGSGHGSETGDEAAMNGGDGSDEGTADSSVEGTAGSTDVVVHVTGQVNTPSVVTLAAGARVQDAVKAAGGLQEEADAEAINLARVLQDGEQIHIPARGEEPEAGRPGPGGAGPGSDSADGTGGSDGAGGSGNAGADPNAAGTVDLNTADLATLETLPGVGPVTAKAIIDQREQQPFGSVDDLLLVTGIGPKTFESLKDRVSVG
ncbi:ComEA family DNA-binding protein [Brevibacterium marinum]|uniref:Competence protein ComEA n=1 Tax=Brevibacterium marinum TaxID=418643 RepID=A0A846S6B7_9MICO|nr:ComEA family DNA-binding protein [Brevibacterium marinum]NJC57611.1 competence protein ComEA [Brevibacterium marinum]